MRKREREGGEGLISRREILLALQVRPTEYVAIELPIHVCLDCELAKIGLQLARKHAYTYRGARLMRIIHVTREYSLRGYGNGKNESGSHYPLPLFPAFDYTV